MTMLYRTCVTRCFSDFILSLFEFVNWYFWGQLRMTSHQASAGWACSGWRRCSLIRPYCQWSFSFKWYLGYSSRSELEFASPEWFCVRSCCFLRVLTIRPFSDSAGVSLDWYRLLSGWICPGLSTSWANRAAGHRRAPHSLTFKCLDWLIFNFISTWSRDPLGPPTIAVVILRFHSEIGLVIAVLVEKV